jgi:hypothetical protein
MFPPIPPRVRRACLLAFALHGILILLAEYRLSYDAYNHMFFASHYARGWWTLWEPRWYAGFAINSYPPLAHQLIALLSRLIGLDAAFAALLWGVLTVLPLAVYHFARIHTSGRAAQFAATGAALLPSAFLTAHPFGQLPTLLGTLFALLGAVVLEKFLRGGKPLTGALGILLVTTMMAAHHAVLLFIPWLAAGVLLRALARRRAPARRLLLRFGAFSLLSGIGALLVIWPFWAWGRTQSIQETIDHLSRHNYFTDPFAAVLFFLPAYGLLIPLIPPALRTAVRRRYRGLGCSFLFLFLLGLGDTTPLPRLLFGAGWAWLTYDRFAFWASLMLLPFLGVHLALLVRRGRLRACRWFVSLSVLIAFVIGFIPSWLPTQPKAVDMQPLADFLASGGRANWRYLTFGFGDQFARLSLLTEAATLDGSYHTARTLPELRASGIGQIDTAYWLAGGIAKLDPILQASGKLGVRWGFENPENREFYTPVLERNGWITIGVLSNGVTVWENPDAVLPPPVSPPGEDPLAAISWGVLPLLSLAVTLWLGGAYLRARAPAG